MVLTASPPFGHATSRVSISAALRFRARALGLFGREGFWTYVACWPRGVTRSGRGGWWLTPGADEGLRLAPAFAPVAWLPACWQPPSTVGTPKRSPKSAATSDQEGSSDQSARQQVREPVQDASRDSTSWQPSKPPSAAPPSGFPLNSYRNCRFMHPKLAPPLPPSRTIPASVTSWTSPAPLGMDDATLGSSGRPTTERDRMSIWTAVTLPSAVPSY